MSANMNQGTVTTIQTANAELPDSAKFTQLKDLISNSFMHDWAISIEYEDISRAPDCAWLKWNQTQFAIKDPAPILRDIVDCCRRHPHCSMKLICEHFNPDYRFVYCIKSD